MFNGTKVFVVTAGVDEGNSPAVVQHESFFSHQQQQQQRQREGQRGGRVVQRARGLLASVLTTSWLCKQQHFRTLSLLLLLIITTSVFSARSEVLRLFFIRDIECKKIKINKIEPQKL